MIKYKTAPRPRTFLPLLEKGDGAMASRGVRHGRRDGQQT